MIKYIKYYLAKWLVQRAIESNKKAIFYFVHYSPTTIGWAKGKIHMKYADLFFAIGKAIDKRYILGLGNG